MDVGAAVLADSRPVAGSGASSEDDNLGATSCRVPEGAGVFGAGGSGSDTCANVCPEHAARVGTAAAAAHGSVESVTGSGEVLCIRGWHGIMLSAAASSGLHELGGGMLSIAADGCTINVELVSLSLDSS